MNVPIRDAAKPTGGSQHSQLRMGKDVGSRVPRERPSAKHRNQESDERGSSIKKRHRIRHCRRHLKTISEAMAAHNGSNQERGLIDRLESAGGMETSLTEFSRGRKGLSKNDLRNETRSRANWGPTSIHPFSQIGPTRPSTNASRKLQRGSWIFESCTARIVRLGHKSDDSLASASGLYREEPRTSTSFPRNFSRFLARSSDKGYNVEKIARTRMVTDKLVRDRLVFRSWSSRVADLTRTLHSTLIGREISRCRQQAKCSRSWPFCFRSSGSC